MFVIKLFFLIADCDSGDKNGRIFKSLVVGWLRSDMYHPLPIAQNTRVVNKTIMPCGRKEAKS